MKGPMYSTAERNFESINSTMDQFSKRMYLSKANPNRFFRQPIQVYPSLLLTNPSKSCKIMLEIIRIDIIAQLENFV